MRFDWDKNWGEDYDDVYDTLGNPVATLCCDAPMKFDGYGYICPACRQRISRREFFEFYVEPFGEECLSCSTNFPRCIICHKNHQEECDRYNDECE